MTKLELDYETKSEIQLSTRHKAGRGLDVYSADPSTKALMCAYAFDGADPRLWTHEDGPFPRELEEALKDPHVEKWAFNAQFERIITKRVLKIDTPYEGWRCAMVLGYMRAFIGDLATMGRLTGVPEDKAKLAEGSRLIKKFCQPQKPTKKSPIIWRDSWTDPEDWELFGQYCIQDVIAERSMRKRLIKFRLPQEEWELYEIDQRINDVGLPIDMQFVRNAEAMGIRRKQELTEELQELTGLSNPNSPQQLGRWLQERGYPFGDLRKDTVKKVLSENAERAGAATEVLDHGDDEDDPTLVSEVTSGGFLSPEAVTALNLRQQSARTSVRKYTKIRQLVGPGDRLRFGFQFGGASRTLRWAGRGLNPQNLTRLPKELETGKETVAAGTPEDFLLALATQLIRDGDYDGLKLLVSEPMNALAGCVRSAICAEDGYELMAADLSSIETCVIAWVSGCRRLLEVLRNKKDAYKDFAKDLYEKPEEEITKPERQNAKPAVLGAGFRLGGGMLIEGKKTGLWAYAESLGVNMTQEEAHRAVRIYRESYPEIPKLWYALEDACKKAMRQGRRVAPVIRHEGKTFVVPVVIEMIAPFLTIELPSGRRLFYHKPRIQKQTMYREDGSTWEKENLSYMGKTQLGNNWTRIVTHGGKTTENIVQAIARDVLAVWLRRAFKAGFPIIGHVHDELINMILRGSNCHTVESIIELLPDDEPWLEGLPLGAAGWTAPFYRKD